MQPGTEGLMGGGFAVWVKNMRIFDKGGIAIGCGQKASHLLALVNIKTKTRGVFISKSGEEMQRRVEAQDFFNQLRRHLTIGARQKRFERIAQRMHCGLMPSVEQQYAGGDQLGTGELFACFLSCNEIGQ